MSRNNNIRNRPVERVKTTGGCIRCKKAEWVRGKYFCGKTRLTERQLVNKYGGYCSEFEEKTGDTK